MTTLYSPQFVRHSNFQTGFCPGDIDEDGDVGQLDLAYVLGKRGVCRGVPLHHGIA